MSIKYHQYGLGYEYGEDHFLTDNWNPDLDYGNEYVRVAFNMETPSYNRNLCFVTMEESKAWRTEVSNTIKALGILEDSGWTVEHSDHKCAYLFAHPQQISGVVLKNDVKRIAEALNEMEQSSLRWVDLRETVYDISDSEYAEYLNGKTEEIRNALFEKASTTRTTHYCSAFEVARSVASKVRLHRLGHNDGKNFGSGQTVEYILKVADEMLAEGYLKDLEQNGQKYIRSLNKTEQKQSGLKMLSNKRKRGKGDGQLGLDLD